MGFVEEQKLEIKTSFPKCTVKLIVDLLHETVKLTVPRMISGEFRVDLVFIVSPKFSKVSVVLKVIHFLSHPEENCVTDRIPLIKLFKDCHLV